MNNQTIFPSLIHGGDYNPDQWLDRPDILEADIRMMKKAKINCVSLAIFAWSTLEPEEGKFNLQWLHDVVDRLYENGIYVIMATPSGARPRWLAQKYPEVLRVNARRERMLFGERHNHCYTSPAYREKVRIIDRKLAEEFASHPAVILWHISNEFGGDCHCPLCQEAFRSWLKDRYGSIDKLNHAWWTAFWSHTYNDFSQIESPSPLGDSSLHGLSLDWMRFVTAQTADFIRVEKQALKDGGALQPVTTNLMRDFTGLDYSVISKEIDIVSWDNYPFWHTGSDIEIAYETALQHDLMRSYRQKPFLMMESSPSSMNWPPLSRLRRPGTVPLTSMQAIAHGSDSVQYFQIRQSRGSSEKFHGAVIDHYGGEDTRVFAEICRTGEDLASLSCLVGTRVDAKAAVITDMESRWAMEAAAGPRNIGLHYSGAVLKSYRALREAGLNVDVIDSSAPFDSYKIVAAPMLYMYKEGVPDRLRSFVRQGGILVMTYWSGVVDESDLCFEGATPHELTDVLGLRFEEIDALPDGVTNRFVRVKDAGICSDTVSDNSGENSSENAGGGLALPKSCACEYLCELVKPEGAKVLMVYGDDFYAGHPALTVNRFGEGAAYYVAADAEQAFYTCLYREIARKAGLSPLLEDLPDNTCAASRTDGQYEYVFAGHYAPDCVQIKIPQGAEVLCGNKDGILDGYSYIILRRISS